MSRVRRTTIAVVLLLLTVGAAQQLVAQSGEFRIGLEFGNPSAVLVLRPAPWDFRIGYSFAAPAEFLFVGADYRLVDRLQLIDFIDLFFGVGLYSQFQFGNPGTFQFGGRVPIGLQVFLINDVVELFVEIAPTVQFLPGIAFDFSTVQGFAGVTVRLPRFWR